MFDKRWVIYIVVEESYTNLLEVIFLNFYFLKFLFGWNVYNLNSTNIRYVHL